MPLVEEDAVDDAFHSLVDGGVLEHQVRRLAAQLQRVVLSAAGEGAADQLADLGGAGEGDLVDVAVLDDGRARLAGRR